MDWNVVTTEEHNKLNTVEKKLDILLDKFTHVDTQIKSLNDKINKIDENNKNTEKRIHNLLGGLEQDRQLYSKNKETYISLLSELKEQEKINSEQLLKGQQSISNITNKLMNPSNIHRMFNSAWRTSSKHSTIPSGLDLEKLIYSKQKESIPEVDWDSFIDK